MGVIRPHSLAMKGEVVRHDVSAKNGMDGKERRKVQREVEAKVANKEHY